MTNFRNLLNSLKREDVQVKFYQYRTARLRNVIMVVERDKQAKRLQEMLAKKVERDYDNHTVYEITYEDGMTFGVMFHDFQVYIGLGITEERW